MDESKGEASHVHPLYSNVILEYVGITTLRCAVSESSIPLPFFLEGALVAACSL